MYVIIISNEIIISIIILVHVIHMKGEGGRYMPPAVRNGVNVSEINFFLLAYDLKSTEILFV